MTETQTPEQSEILTEAIAEAVRDTLFFATGAGYCFTVSPLTVREMADGSGRFAVFGTFVEGEDFHEVHTRRIVGSFSVVEVIKSATTREP